MFIRAHHLLRQLAIALSLLALNAMLVVPAYAQVTAMKGLTFGASPLISGTTTTVAPNTANAAVFRIRGILGVGGNFSFTLPSTLLHTNGVTTMPITFGAGSGAYRFGSSTPGGTTFNPATGVSGLYVVVLTDIYIFVGASLSPPLNQKAGSYSGTIVFTSSALL
ncbi:MAG: hypothetical protein ACO1Q7_17755 [Gemmatimonas sp.]